MGQKHRSLIVPIAPGFAPGQFRPYRRSELPPSRDRARLRLEPIFIEDRDQEVCRDILGERTREADGQVWGWRL